MSLPSAQTYLNVRGRDGVPVVSSRDVAERFEREHRNVLRDIDAILSTRSDLSASGWFIETDYLDAKGETRRAYDLTRQAFTLLVMGWTGEKAMEFKVRYIQAFDAMEAALKSTAPTAHDQFLAAVREIVAPLAGRFQGQDDAIGRVEKRVDDVANDVKFLKDNLIVGRRRNLTEGTKRQHIEAIKMMGGKCPCCRVSDVVEGEQRSAFSEFDHFWTNSNAGIDHTWLICKPCHTQLTTGKVSRDGRTTEFNAYQQLRRRLPGNQPKLFD